MLRFSHVKHLGVALCCRRVIAPSCLTCLYNGMAADAPLVAVLLWHLMETKLLLPLKNRRLRITALPSLRASWRESLLFQAARNDFCDES